MKDFVLAGCQMACKPMDVDFNVQKGVEWIPKAVNCGGELLVFPETITTGFNINCTKEELWDMVDFAGGKITKPVQEAAKKHKVHVIWPSYERGETRGVIYNSAFLIGPDGEIIGTYRKTHPWPGENIYGIGWVEPGTEAVPFETELGTIGIIICYDGDFPDLSTTLAIRGAEVICRPAALLRSYDHWWATNFARAYDNHVYLAAVNAVGPDILNTYYFGHSMIIQPNGWKIAQGRCAEEIVFARLTTDGLKYVYGGMSSEQIFDHMTDRNLEVYDVMHESKSHFEPSKRIDVRKK
ncbi:MAG TPA: carbon-nitrogen hydrolase family protein [Synergistales bacterium]|nr:carbon-nitrogen hydrolase family protein [Synergistales bacterium]